MVHNHEIPISEMADKIDSVTAESLQYVAFPVFGPKAGGQRTVLAMGSAILVIGPEAQIGRRSSESTTATHPAVPSAPSRYLSNRLYVDLIPVLTFSLCTVGAHDFVVVAGSSSMLSRK